MDMLKAMFFHIEGHVRHMEPYMVDATNCWKCSSVNTMLVVGHLSNSIKCWATSCVCR